MLQTKKRKRNLGIVLIIAVVVGLTMTAWAKKPDKPGGGKPGGGGEDPVGTGTIYYSNGGYFCSMNPDGSGKTLLPVGGVASMTRHPAEADRWFLQLREMDGDFYPITTTSPDYWLEMSGLNDLEVVGFTGDPSANRAWGHIFYNIEIDGEGEPDTFRWRANSSLFEGSPMDWVTGVPITGGEQKLVYGSTCLTIKFDFITGHSYDLIGDAWSLFVQKTQRHELFADREDGLVEVQLTDDPTVQPWAPGEPVDYRALPSWATHDGVVDGKVSYLAQRWGQDAQDEDIVLERGLFAVEINWDSSGEPSPTSVPTKLPVTLPMSSDSLEIPYDWSPDGNRVVYWDWAEGIRVANAYIEGPGDLLCDDGYDPRWSPVLDDVGSTLIAFQTGSWGEAKIRTISPGGGSPSTIIALGKNCTIWGGMDWSPSGTHLIYTRIQRKGSISNDSYDVYRVGADGSDATNLTNNLREYAFSMSWRD
jgi:hypothetical protein